MVPANEQISFDVSLSAGMLPASTVGAPGSHVPAGTGVHGIGVSTPRAAAVADATAGFAMLVHIPKGGMFTNGTVSLMVPTGMDEAMTRGLGRATSP